MGLMSKSSHPAARACSRSPAIACAVSAMTGMPRVRRVGLQLPRRLPAVDAGQAHVHEDQGRGLRSVRARPLSPSTAVTTS